MNPGNKQVASYNASLLYFRLMDMYVLSLAVSSAGQERKGVMGTRWHEVNCAILDVRPYLPQTLPLKLVVLHLRVS